MEDIVAGYFTFAANILAVFHAFFRDVHATPKNDNTIAEYAAAFVTPQRFYLRPVVKHGLFYDLNEHTP
jgi:hypothetical protein